MQIPFYLINLDSAKDRLAFSDSQLTARNIQYTRIAAVNGSTIHEAFREQIIGPAFSGYHKILHNNELGCFLSHIKCWEALLKTDHKFAFILEDDFTIENDLQNVAATIDMFEGEWDCIKLCEHPLKRKAIKQQALSDMTLITYNKIPAGTCAYVISRSGAQKMLNYSQKIVRPIDIQFQYWWENDMKVFGLKPYPIAIRSEISSTIDDQGKSSRSKSRTNIGAKLKQHSRYTWLNYWRTRQSLNRQ